MEHLVVVVDEDRVSKMQLEALHGGPQELHGVLRCDLFQNADSRLCHEVRAFPAFCHTAGKDVASACTYGLRETPEALQKALAEVTPGRCARPPPA